jgi:TIR domain
MRIFISYRREDSAGYTGRLYDHLATYFGEKDLFMDIDTIRPGQDFVTAIEYAISQCDAVLAVIGKQWLTLTASDGVRRIDKADDFVRLEIESALRRNVLVIPVLVDGAIMPKPENLPADLHKFSRLNALPLSHDRFRYDVGRLVEALEAVPEQPQAAKPTDLLTIQGYWATRGGEIDAYFRQNNLRIIGIYRLAEQKVGVYKGELAGHVFEFEWTHMGDQLKGHGRVILSGNRKKLSGYYWIGDNDEGSTSDLQLYWVGGDVPNWVSEDDFAKHQDFLNG